VNGDRYGPFGRAYKRAVTGGTKPARLAPGGGRPGGARRRLGPFGRSFLRSLAVTLLLFALAAWFLAVPLGKPSASEEAARTIADRLELDLSRGRLTERRILARAGSEAALGIEQIEQGLRLIVRIQDDADESGWPCYRLTVRRGNVDERNAVERLPSCPVAAPLRPRDDTELTELEGRVETALDQLPPDFSSEAAVLGELVKADLPVASAHVDTTRNGVGYVAVGAQPRCVLGFVRPPGEVATRVYAWLAPPGRPCTSATAAEFAGLY
jgi:hypothetical protein